MRLRPRSTSTRRLLLASAVGLAAIAGVNPADARIVRESERLCFDVAGRRGDLAVVNLTPVEATGPGNGQVISSDLRQPPLASNVNFGPGTVDPNVAIAPIGADGSVCFINSHHANVHLVADHLGTIAAGAFTAPSADGTSVRTADTRPTWGGAGPVAPAGRACFGVAGNPGDVAIVNLTPVEATGPGHGQLVSSDVHQPPVASNVNFGPGTVDPNVALAPIGANGDVCFVNSDHSWVHLVADHLGTIDAASFEPARSDNAPQRVLDSRIGHGHPGRIDASGHVCFAATGDPGDVAVVNLTPVEALGPGYGQLVSYVGGTAPVASNVNFAPGTIDPNVALAAIGQNGEVCYRNSSHSAVHLVADHLGTIDGASFDLADTEGSPRRVADTRTDRYGRLTEDETWSGTVRVTDTLEVPSGVTLTILPGTRVEFRHDRGYLLNDYPSALLVTGGTVIADGTPSAQIRFTSDADDPINGDWAGIRILDSTQSVFDHVIVEYALLGISQFDSTVPITNSIIRWSNTEGLYAERSTPRFEGNHLYGNGYHEIALEQFNSNVVIRNNVFRDGYVALHTEATTVLVEGNTFQGYGKDVITAGQSSTLTVRNNLFADNIATGFTSTDPGTTFYPSGNTWQTAAVDVTPPYPLGEETTLGYLPGALNDQFRYVYPPVDETRRVLQRMGKDQGFSWSITYANGYLWRFQINHPQRLVRIDPATGASVHWDTTLFQNPRGLTWDGSSFWTNDFTEREIVEFVVGLSGPQVLQRFPIPDKELGGTFGLAWDGSHLYLPARGEPFLYRIDRSGNEVGRVDLKGRVWNDLTWMNGEFWATGGGCSHHICRLAPNGDVLGGINAVAYGTWALTNDGIHLWTIQRTSETWNDEKIFKIEILDDSV